MGVTRWAPRPVSAFRYKRQGGDQRLAFAGLHFGDLALVQHDPADQLLVEVAQSDRPRGGLSHGREGARQDLVHGVLLNGLEFLLEALDLDLEPNLHARIGLELPLAARLLETFTQVADAFGDQRPEFVGLRAQLVVAHRGEFGAQGVYLVDDRLESLDLALVGITEYFLSQIL